MTETPRPTELTLTSGSMAMDGGSIHLQAIDPSRIPVEITLDWSVGSQRTGTTQLYVNEVPVRRGSPDERGWLDLVRRAPVRADRAPEQARGTRLSAKRIVLGEPAETFLQAVDEGPEAAIAHLAMRLVSLVSSAAYQEGQPPPPRPPPPRDAVQTLLAEGNTKAAIHAYRAAHPDVGLAAARAAVKALAEEIRTAPSRPAAPDGASSLDAPGSVTRR